MIGNNTAVRTAFYSLVMVGMFVLVTGTAAAEGTSESNDYGSNYDGSQDSPGESKYQGESCQEKAERAYMFGVFSEDYLTIEGRFVEFNYGEGAIFNYTLINEDEDLIFKSIILEDFITEGIPRMDGAVFRMNGTASELWVHNNPTGMIQVTASKEGNPVIITCELAEGLALSKLTNGTYEITGLSSPAFLRTGAAEISISGSSISVDIGEHGHFMFSSIPVKGYGGSEYRYSYTMAVMEGKIDSELNVVTSGGESLEQKFEYQGKVQMKLSSLEQNRLRIMVESEEHKGKVVGINIDKESLGAEKREQIMVKLDGKELKKASNIEEVLECSDDYGLYWIEESNDGIQAVVYVPSFSEHEITIEKISGDGEPGALLMGNITAIIIALVIIGLMLFLVLRTKDRN